MVHAPTYTDPLSQLLQAHAVSEPATTCCSHPMLTAVLQVGDGVFEVLSTSGDTHLGGDDFDRRIVDYLADDFQRGEGIDLRKDRQALQRLTEAAEKAKMELSTLSQVTAHLLSVISALHHPF